MSKPLFEMSLEELWELFPIKLTPHQSYWKDWYQEEKKELEGILPTKEVVGIHHIGSTAVATIWAKPIIDILVEIPKSSNMKYYIEILLQKGYIMMSQSEKRISFNKGYTEHGFAERVFHIHLRFMGDIDELYFRDYLRANPTIAREYEQLKLELWKKYEHNRDAYTDAKTDFIQKYTKLAKQEQNYRYC